MLDVFLTSVTLRPPVAAMLIRIGLLFGGYWPWLLACSFALGCLPCSIHTLLTCPSLIWFCIEVRRNCLLPKRFLAFFSEYSPIQTTQTSTLEPLLRLLRLVSLSMRIFISLQSLNHAARSVTTVGPTTQYFLRAATGTWDLWFEGLLGQHLKSPSTKHIQNIVRA